MPRSRRDLGGAVLAAALVASAPARAEDAVGTLLGRLAPPAPQGTVKLLSWVEEADRGAELVITFIPEGGVKLVADPGVTVTPVARDGIAWTGAVPLHHARAGLDYFAPPLTLRLPFTGGDGRPVDAAVEYAYCVVDQQCLFGQATVSAATIPQG